MFVAELLQLEEYCPRVAAVALRTRRDTSVPLGRRYIK